MYSEYSKIRRRVVLEYLEKYPQTPSRTIARIIVRDNPGLFSDLEDARGLIRMFRGQSGEGHRKSVRLTKHYTYEI
jgi:hypothetical protein